MHPLSVIVTVLSFFLWVRAAPLPLDQSRDKRESYGRGTWFYDDTNQSACGYWDNNNESIVALSAQIYGSGGNCGQWVQVTANGQTAYGMVGDECESCGSGDLDMSMALFQKFADLSVGVLSITWDFMPQGWSPS